MNAPEPVEPADLEALVDAAMREEWDEICADTDCHPLDIVQERNKAGRRTGVLSFTPGHWASAIAANLKRALQRREPPLPEEVREPLAEYLAGQDKDDWCQRLKYGKCSLRRCLVNAEGKVELPADFGKASCPRYRLEQARLSSQRPVEEGVIQARLERLEGHIAEQIQHVEQRIKDGIELGATVWRIALEDVARENRAALKEPDNG